MGFYLHEIEINKGTSLNKITKKMQKRSVIVKVKVVRDKGKKPQLIYQNNSLYVFMREFRFA